MSANTNSNSNDIDPDLNLLDTLLPSGLCRYYDVLELNNVNLNTNSFSLLNYNIRSFHKNGPSFESLLDNLHINFKCLVITETWINENNLNLCSLPNYNSFHTYRPFGHIYASSGGVSVLCDSELKANKNTNLSLCNAHIETCIVDFKYRNELFTIVGIYRPPRGNKEDFLSELDRILNSIDTVHRTITLVGDFNLNLDDLDDVHVANFVTKLYADSYLPIINCPTRFPPDNSTQNPSTLDMIWTNKLGIEVCGIINFDVTDHLPTFCIFESFTPNHNDNKVKIVSRPFTELNLENLSDEVAHTPWDDILDYDDVDNCIMNFIDKLNLLYTKHFPIKTKYVSHKRFKNKWITQEIKRLINIKSESFRKLKHGLITKEENNTIKNLINAKVNKAKDKYYRTAFDIYKNNAKKSWKLLGELMGRNGSKKDYINSLVEDGVEITGDQQIANTFADYFSNIGSELENALPHTDVSPCAHINRNINSFCLFPVSPEECLTVISKLKLTRTAMNNIPVKIFKSISHLICLPLTKIINASFTQGIFPYSLKLAKITPVHKRGDVKLCTNYRPISSLPFLSKIYERLMANRIISFFNSFSLFSSKQFGFLENRSTADAIHDFLESCYDALDNTNFNISILVDLKAAFDTVNHNILISKLEHYGIRGAPLDWFRSYLKNRVYQVGIRQTYSSKCTVNIGIPQGSILGPILFIIYNNDLPQVSNILNTTLFADDTNFSLTHTSYSDMIPILNTELDKIYHWTLANRLTINTNKTELLLFTNKRITSYDHHVILGGDRIEFVDHAKFLGVLLDDKLNFKLHVGQVVGKIAKHAGILYKIRNRLPRTARIRYYNSFVLPYLTYNVHHWGNTNDVHLKSLVLTQKRIIRCIADADYLAHTTPIFHQLGILKLEDVYKYNSLIDTFLKLQDNEYTTNHGVNTRYSMKARPKGHILSRTKQSVSYSGPNLWNSLPNNLRNIKSLTLFKKQLKQTLLQKYLT